jgi:hypothetical protein
MQVLEELTGERQIITLFSDNKAAIQMTENGVHQPRSKHISIRYHFARDLVKRKQINIIHTPGINNLADYMTKPTGQVKMKQFTDIIFKVEKIV